MLSLTKVQNSSSDTDAKVPLASRVPLVGHLFKQKARESIKSELVILLKPIVVDTRAQQAALDQSRAHIERLRRKLRERG